MAGDYTFFIGEEVSQALEIPAGLMEIFIPAQTYVKFTTDSGVMPDVCINAKIGSGNSTC